MPNYGMQNRASGYNQNYDYGNDSYNNPDDEPLDNYLAVQDAEAVTVDKSFGNPNDFYYTETYPYDGRLSPDNFENDHYDDNDLEIIDDDMNDRDLRNDIQSRAIKEEYNRQYEYEQQQKAAQRRENTFYEERGGGGGGRRDRGRSDRRADRDYDDYNRNSQARPRTGRASYGVDSSYYLDDPNDD